MKERAEPLLLAVTALLLLAASPRGVADVADESSSSPEASALASASASLGVDGPAGEDVGDDEGVEWGEEFLVKPTVPIGRESTERRRAEVEGEGAARRILGKRRRKRKVPKAPPADPEPSPPESGDGGSSSPQLCSHSKKKPCSRDPLCKWEGKGKNGVCSPKKPPSVTTTTTTAPPKPMIQSRKGKYERDEGVVCDFENPSAEAGDWIGLYREGAEVDGYVPGRESAVDWFGGECRTKDWVKNA